MATKEFLSSYDDLETANACLHKLAESLRKKGLTKTHGVKVERRARTYWVVLVTRGN